MNAHRLLIMCTVMVLNFCIVGGCSKKSNKNEKVIPIGVILSLTGKAATYGERALEGIQLAIDEIDKNEKDKSKIRLIIEDSHSSGVKAVSSFNKLVDIDHVSVVIGLLSSDEAMACAPIATRKEIVVLSPGATSTELKKAGKWFFRNRESVELQTNAIAKYISHITTNGNIAIMYANASNAISYKNTFEEAYSALGGKVVGVVAFTEGKTDYKTELKQVQQMNADGIYVAGYDTELGLILKQAKELGIIQQFFASAGAITPKVFEIAGDAAEGLIAASALFDPKSEQENIQSFVNNYTQRFGREPDWLAANAYDAIYLIVQAYENGNTSADAIRTYLSTVTNFNGITGNLTFDEHGGVVKKMSICMAKNGSFITLKQDSIEGKTE